MDERNASEHKGEIAKDKKGLTNDTRCHRMQGRTQPNHFGKPFQIPDFYLPWYFNGVKAVNQSVISRDRHWEFGK